MITAKEAKTLYDESGVEVEQFLKYNIEPDVTKAAKSGLRKVEILIGSLGPFDHVDQHITPLQRAVLRNLTQLGYTAAISKYGSSYVPRGLADDDGGGPSHTNYGFIIAW